MISELIPFASNSAIEAQQTAVASEKDAAAESFQKPSITNLAGYLRGLWQKALDAKREVEQQMLRNKRARLGQYEPEKLAAIQSVDGKDATPVFMMITETKCRAAESWIKDIILQPGEEPWDIMPTPLPELPQETMAKIMQEIMERVAQSAMQSAMAAGIIPDQNVMANAVASVQEDIQEMVDKEVMEQAREGADRMREKISDQFVEGGFYKALEEAIYDIVTYKAGVIKGPVMKKQIVRERTVDPVTGSWKSVTKERIVPVWERRSPIDIYPSPDATSVDDGYIFDKISMTRNDLSMLIGVPGYNEAAIRRVLSKHSVGGLREWTSINSERDGLENKDTRLVYDTERIDCLEYNGSAPGKIIKEWGIDDPSITDDLLEYDITAWMIGDDVIKAMLNPNPLGRKYYCKASFVEDPDSFWGRGLPELILHAQQMGNQAGRFIVKNVAFSAGPQTEVNVDRLAPGEQGAIFPFKVWHVTNAMMSEGKAVNFYAPPIVSQQLIEVYEYCLKLADEDSGVPRYAHGDTTVGGGGSTASGLTMLMTQAARGIKSVVKAIDNGIIRPSVERQYHYNLEYEDLDFEVISDLNILARGSSSLIAKEQQAVRRAEFMAQTANPIDMQILGVRGRKALLMEAAKSLEMDPEKLFGSEEEQEEQEEQAQMAQQGMPMGGGQMAPQGGQMNMQMKTAPDVAAPQTLDGAGSPAQGQDTNLYSVPPRMA